MRAHKSKLERLNKSIRQPDKITLTVKYADGHIEPGLSLDAELRQDAEQVMILNGERVLGYWLDAVYWLAI